MKRLQHPNIVAYKDSFFANDKDNLCIVMTYCDGGDLSARLAGSKGALIKEDQIMHWFVQVRSGTEATAGSVSHNLLICPLLIHGLASLCRHAAPMTDCARHPLHAREPRATP